MRQMNKKALLLLSAAVLVALPMCADYKTLYPAGSVAEQDTVADSLVAEARSLRKAGKLGKAESKYKRVAEFRSLAPVAPEARFELGQVYEEQKDYREAFRQYSRLIQLYPQSPLYKAALDRQMAMAFAAAKGEMQVDVLFGAWSAPMDASVVIEWLRTIITHAPYNDMAATASSILAGFLVDQEKYDEARAEYARLVATYPDSPLAPDSQLMVASLWASRSTRGDADSLVNLTHAREAYEEFCLRFPKHKNAIKAYNGAADMERLLVNQQLEVGRYYLERAREYPSAIFCFEDVIRQKKTNPEAAREAEQLLEKARAAQKSAQQQS